MPLFFSRVLLYYWPLACPSTLYQLLMLMWPKANSIDLLQVTYPGLPHLSLAGIYGVHLTLSLLTKFGAHSPYVAPPFFPPRSVYAQHYGPARSYTATIHV